MSTPTLLDSTTVYDRGSLLRRFGYAPDEAGFLALAALLGGYFLRRQVAQFLDRQDGGAVSRLVQRALDLEHLRCSTWAKGVHLYHLGSRPFYEALGEDDNRNRRRHELAQIKHRLMCLDYALSRNELTPLATERDRLSFFGALEIPTELLPHKQFVSSNCTRSTTRYFVDRQPILVTPAIASTPPHLTFVFVDEGLITLSRFERFLKEHARLFGALLGFNLVYVANSPKHFKAAATLAGSCLGLGSTPSLPLGDGPNDQLVRYFELRRRFEQRQFSSFNREQLLQLRNARDTFQASEIEEQYRQWRSAESAPLATVHTGGATDPAANSKTFSTELLIHDYALFDHFLPQ